MGSPADRRPLKSRNSAWARRAAVFLAAKGVTPNVISLFSVVFGGLAMLAFIATKWNADPIYRAACLLVAIIGMQMRLICNLLDGMVAVEAGAGVGKCGDLYNDLPDRVADVLIFFGAGLCAGGREGPILGLLAAVGSLMTAYVRVLGKAVGAGSYFIGPMAKQHRMATMTVGCLVGMVIVFFGRYLHAWMIIPLSVVIAGCVITCVRRLLRIVADLEAK